MTADSVTARAQAAAEALMVDACVIKRCTTHNTDPETGHIAYNFNTLYTGKCRVQRRTLFNRPRDTGEAFITLLALEVQLPMSLTTEIQGDDIITITASQDPVLVGRDFHVRGFQRKTHASNRKLNCIEVGS